jgi:hypothetical protein
MNAANEKCCVPTKKGSAGGSSALTTGSAGALPTILPSCAQSGDCALDDIVRTGANAANFFTALSAGLFFFSFIYGGARYLLSFGRKEWVSAGTKAMTTSALGMAIVMFAWVIVNYVANAIQGKG